MREPARSSVITLRVSVELATRVRAAATDRGVTVNWFAGKLLAEALDDLEAPREVPSDACEGPGGHVTHESDVLHDLAARFRALETENRHLREVATRWRAKAQNLRVAVDMALTSKRAADVVQMSRVGCEGLLGLPWTDDPTWQGEL